MQIYQYCHDICSWRLLNHDSPLMLGSNGVVVQIDESLFRHKPKHHRGRATTNEVWVFGLCDTSQSSALGVMCIARPYCTNSPPHHQTPCQAGDRGSQRPVGSLQQGRAAAAGQQPPDSEPLPPLCGPSNRGLHTKHQILLESREEEVQTHEGGSPDVVELVPRRVHVEGAAWPQCSYSTRESLTRHCPEVPPVDPDLTGTVY